MTSQQQSSIPRLGVLWCPNWAVVAAGSAADEPVVVLHANRVIANSLAAGREGIVVGRGGAQDQRAVPVGGSVPLIPNREAPGSERAAPEISAWSPGAGITNPGR